MFFLLNLTGKEPGIVSDIMRLMFALWVEK